MEFFISERISLDCYLASRHKRAPIAAEAETAAAAAAAVAETAELFASFSRIEQIVLLVEAAMALGVGGCGTILEIPFLR